VGVAVGKAGESGRTLPLLVAGAVGEVDLDGFGELTPAAGGLKDALGWVERNVHRDLALGAVLSAGLEQLPVGKHDGFAVVDGDVRLVGDGLDERAAGVGDERRNLRGDRDVDGRLQLGRVGRQRSPASTFSRAPSTSYPSGCSGSTSATISHMVAGP
jgi:hypothetical protein